jgi:hypothetical protein
MSSRERLTPGGRVRVGDALSMEFRASRPLHLYIINEDEEGQATLLFPLTPEEASRALAPGVAHILPAALAGVQQYWLVTSPGGREHFLVVASPERLVDFEQESLAMNRAEPNQPIQYAPLGAKAMARLRGVAGIVSAPAPRESKATDTLFQSAGVLVAGPESVRGVWIRRIELENPAL